MSPAQGPDQDSPGVPLPSPDDRHRQLVEHLPACLAVYQAVDDGADFVLTELNPAAERAEGVEREAVLGRRVTEVFPGVRELGLLEVLRRAWRTGRPELFPAPRYHDEPRSGWREFTVYRLPSLEVAAVSEDVTERKQSEAALLESEQRFRLLFEGVPVPYQSLDCEGRVLAINAAWLETLGYRREEVIGRSFADFQGPGSAAAFPERFAAYLETGEVHGVEVELLTRDGTVIVALYDGRVATGVDGRVSCTHCVFVDVTERRRAEAALRESEEKYRTLFETMRQGVFYQAADGALLDANPAALRMFGLTLEEFRGRTALHQGWDVVHEDGSPFPGEDHPSMVALASGDPVRDVVAGVLNPRTGERVWMSINATPEFRSGESRPFRVAVTLHDLTERMRAEARLEEQLRELRRWHAVTLDREDRVLELKREVDQTRARAGLEPRYAVSSPDGGSVGDGPPFPPPAPGGPDNGGEG